MVALAIAAVGLVGRTLLLVAQAGQGLQRFGAAAEEQFGMLVLEGAQAEEGAAFETRARVHARKAVLERITQANGQRSARCPAFGLEQREERRHGLGASVAEQNGVDGRACPEFCVRGIA